MRIAVCLTLLIALSAAAQPMAPPRHGVYVVAHRGAHRDAPENTLAACRKAIELGADFVEVDVRTTRDGHYVCVHNGSVDAYADGASGRVAEMTLAQVQALDIGSRVGPEWKDERIPTFEAMLDCCKDRIGVYLDLKDAPVADMARLIAARGMERQVMWYAGPAEFDKLRQCCPSCIPAPDPGPLQNLPPLIERFSPEVVTTVWEHHSAAMVVTCHAAGAMVIPDEDFGAVRADLAAGKTPRCWVEAVAWGSDGIQTDAPEELIAFLTAHAE